jgi:hypothetical protein
VAGILHHDRPQDDQQQRWVHGHRDQPNRIGGNIGEGWPGMRLQRHPAEKSQRERRDCQDNQQAVRLPLAQKQER